MATDDEEIKIAVTINKNYEATENIDSTNDTSKFTKLQKGDSTIAQLRAIITKAFSKSSFQSLFNNSGYEWRIYSFDSNKAEIEIGIDDDLKDEIEEFCGSDDESEGDDDLQSNKSLKLRIVFFARISRPTDHIEPEEQENIAPDEETPSKPTTIVKKGQIYSHYIQPTSITSDEMMVKLSLVDAVSKNTTFFIQELGKEDSLAQVMIRKGKRETVDDVDIDDIEDQSLFSIAAYGKDNRKQPLSNTLQISIPNDEDVKDDYKPNAISISSVEAIEVEDEKEETPNIYVYFEYPQIRGEEILFRINYLKDYNNKYKDISVPLILSKSVIPISFKVITVSINDNKEYISSPSELITIGYPKLLSLMIAFIHNNDKSIEIEFNEDIDFILFQKLIIDELEINNALNNMQIGLNNNNKISIVDDKTFNAVLASVSVHTSTTLTLNVGFNPIVPTISKVNIEQKGALNISLSKIPNNAGNINIIDVESENKADCANINKNELKGKQLKMQINNINPDGKYKLRAKSTNIFGESSWSEWTECFNPRITTKKPEQKEEKPLIQPTDIPSDVQPSAKRPDQKEEKREISPTDAQPSDIQLSNTQPSLVRQAVESTQAPHQSKSNAHNISWDEEPPYFMQITSVLEDDFTIHLSVKEIDHDKKRKFKIKEIRNDGKGTMDDVAFIIAKGKQNDDRDADIEAGHDNTYHLVLCDAKNTNNLIPNVPQLNFTVLRSDYPPSNKNYRPNPIDISTVIKCKDERNNRINIYWSTASNLFGGTVSYKVLLDDTEDQKESIPTEIETLPYVIPLSCIPVSFRVVTMVTVYEDGEDHYESEPSETINIGKEGKQKKQEKVEEKKEEKIKVKEPPTPTTINEWKQFPNLLQITGVESETINARFVLKSKTSKTKKFRIKSLNDGDKISKQFNMKKNKKSEDDIIMPAEPSTMYNLCIFDSDGKQCSNTVHVETAAKTFEASENYKPSPPSIDCIQPYYDEEKGNILITWDHPKSTFGDSIIYRIKLSNKPQSQEITELPYKIPIASAQFTITTVSVINYDRFESNPSKPYDLMIAASIATSPSTKTAPSPTAILSIIYLNRQGAIEQIPIGAVQNLKYKEFKSEIIKTLGVIVNDSTIKALKVYHMSDGGKTFEDIKQGKYKKFVKEQLLNKPVVTLQVYFTPTGPPKLKEHSLHSNQIYCIFETMYQIPFRIEYEVKSKTISKISNTTETACSIIQIKDASNYKPECQIRAKYEFSNIFKEKSKWSNWTKIDLRSLS